MTVLANPTCELWACLCIVLLAVLSRVILCLALVRLVPLWVKDFVSDLATLGRLRILAVRLTTDRVRVVLVRVPVTSRLRLWCVPLLVATPLCSLCR